MSDLNGRKWMRFEEAVTAAPRSPGFYEIKTDRELLKIGIATDLRRRLRQHARSKQSRLKSRLPEPWVEPSQVTSKGSILAKHLYFDHSLTRGYNLRIEKERLAFLREQCWVCFTPTRTREAARQFEMKAEASGSYRYVGTVVSRHALPDSPPAPR